MYCRIFLSKITWLQWPKYNGRNKNLVGISNAIWRHGVTRLLMRNLWCSILETRIWCAQSSICIFRVISFALLGCTLFVFKKPNPQIHKQFSDILDTSMRLNLTYCLRKALERTNDIAPWWSMCLFKSHLQWHWLICPQCFPT